MGFKTLGNSTVVWTFVLKFNDSILVPVSAYIITGNYVIIFFFSLIKLSVQTKCRSV